MLLVALFVVGSVTPAFAQIAPDPLPSTTPVLATQVVRFDRASGAWQQVPGTEIRPLPAPGWNGDPGFWIVPLPMPPQWDGDPGFFIIIGPWNGDPGMIINPVGVEDVLRQAGVDVATPRTATAASDRSLSRV